MIIIAKPPKEGKTTELVEKYFLPKWEETVLLIDDRDERKFLFEKFGLSLKQMSNIMTYKDFIDNFNPKQTRIKYLLIDDITHFLFSMFQPLSVEAITLQTNKEPIAKT